VGVFYFLFCLKQNAFRGIHIRVFLAAVRRRPKKWSAEKKLLLWRTIAPLVLLKALLIGCLAYGTVACSPSPKEPPRVTINRQPVNFARRTFDPVNPPSGMPPLTQGENAACDSDFLSNAIVGGETRPTDATHATVTITHIKMNLQLNINIWVPNDVTEHVTEHEQGHRQISEYYYQAADKLAEQIAKPYVGKQVDITGTNLQLESDKFLQQTATAITTEYNRQLNPEPTQLLYDSITDHSRNEVIVKDAVAHAIKNVSIESPQPIPRD
jgi:hypothetical protein